MTRSPFDTKLNFAADSGVGERLAFSAVATLIVILAVANQIRLGVYTDPLWLMVLCDRLLDGQTAYADFFENSPPLAILLYMPPVLLARTLGVAREPLFVGYVFALAGASLAASWWILVKSGRFADVGWSGALAALASLL